MTIALTEFWKALDSLGICDERTAKSFESLVESGSADIQYDSISAAKYLIKKGILTRYQAKMVLSSQADDLRQGGYLILSDKGEIPFQKWISARHQKTKQRALFKRMDKGQVAPFLLDPNWFKRTKKIKSLQKYVLSESDGRCEIITSLPSGATLTQRLAHGNTFDIDAGLKFGSQIVGAIRALPDRHINPVNLTTDHLWITDSGEGILLFEPSLHAARSNEEYTNCLIPSESATSYLPPEAHLENQVVHESSLVFSLGCLLYRLVTGKEAYSSLVLRGYQSMFQAGHSVPAELVEAIENQASGNMIFRVLAYALAPNPASRFQSLEQFEAAWRRVESHHTEEKEVQATKKKSEKSEDSKDDRPKELESISDRQKKGSEDDSKISVVHPETNDKDSSTEISDSKPVKGKKTAQPKLGDRTLDTEDRGSKSTSSESTDTDLKSPTTVPEYESSAESQLSAQSVRKSHEEEPPESEASTPRESQVLPDLVRSEKKKKPSIEDEIQIEPTTADSSDDTVASVPVSEENSGKDEPTVPVLVTDATPVVTGKTGSVSGVRRRKKKSNAPLILGGMCVAVLMLLIGLIVSGSGEGDIEPQAKQRRPLPKVIPPVVNGDSDQTSETTEVVESETIGYELVQDGQLLFVPPYGTDTTSIPLSLLPPGPAVIVSCRLGDFVDHPLGENLLTGVSTGADRLVEQAVTRSKMPVESIDRLIITMFPGESGWPEVALAVHLAEPIQESELIETLAVEQARTRENKQIYIGDQDDSDAYYWNATEGEETVSVYAIGTVPRISEVAGLDGSDIPLPRTSQALWADTSVDSDLVVLFTPNFLFADGREMLKAAAPEFIAPLKRFMQPDINACLFTLYFNTDETVFLETRYAPSGGISEPALMRKVSDSIESLPEWANQFILDTTQDPSWKLLAIRMPQMMQYLSSKTRVGISDNAVVANTYLPQAAFPQLAFAGLLAMNTSTTGVAIEITPEAEMLTIDQMLDRKMSVSFDQESLEFALEAISNAFQEGLPAGNQMPTAVIVGGDLELMGITQNQQVRDFSKTDKALRDVLTALVVQANPDKSATGPDDPKQSLIWVVIDSEEGGKEIRITTRQAAERESYQVPPEFVGGE